MSGWFEMSGLEKRFDGIKAIDGFSYTIREGEIDTNAWITHRLAFDEVPTEFPKFTDPGIGAIKAIIDVN